MKLNKCILTDLGSVNRGKSKHRPRNDESLFGGDYPFIQTGEVKSANFYLNTFSETYNEKGLAQSKLWEKGTLLITIAANIAETAILDIKACFPDSIIGFIPYENKSDVRFVKYYLDYIKRKLQIISQGTTQDNMSVDKLTSMVLYVPDYDNQVKIANILSNYDNLIENNKKKIKLLEGIAEEIYKEWFVRLRFPNYQNTKIVDGIPDGWKYLNLGNSKLNFIDGDRGKNYPKQDEFYKDGYCLFLSTSNVTKYGFNFENKVFITQEKDNTLGNGKLKYEDIIITTRGTIGNIVLYNLNNQFKNMRINSGMLIIRDENSSFNEYYLHQYFTSKLFQEKAKLFSTGSAQPQLPVSILKSIDILVPTKTILDKFKEFINPIYYEIDILQNKNQNLKQTRDLLLPRLISGKLNIEDLDIK